nr:immunoglobulin light chain junction region [Macaca mulatta]MOW30187.1 immunoglobulin light chain junction region [Macaca mulatta]
DYYCAIWHSSTCIF